MSKSTKTILIIGNFAVVDLLVSGHRETTIPGGAAFNIAVAVKASGALPTGIAVIGTDDRNIGPVISTLIPGFNVINLSGSTCRFEYNLDSKSSEPNITSFYGVATHLTKELLPQLPHLVQSADWVHVCCRQPLNSGAVVAAIRKCYQGPISLDFVAPSIIEHFENIHSLLSATDYLFMNSTEYNIVTSSYPRLCNQIVRTEGARGVSLLCEDSIIDHIHATAVNSVVDPTGAGDVFIGAFIAAAAGGATPREAMQLGCALGAEAVKDYGVRRIVEMLQS